MDAGITTKYSPMQRVSCVGRHPVLFRKGKGHFTKTFTIGNVVASHDSTSLPLVTLRRCPSRLNDEDSAETARETVLYGLFCVVSLLEKSVDDKK